MMIAIQIINGNLGPVITMKTRLIISRMFIRSLTLLSLPLSLSFYLSLSQSSSGAYFKFTITKMHSHEFCSRDIIQLALLLALAWHMAS